MLAFQATTQHVYRDAQMCDVPGLGLHTNFVSPDEEKAWHSPSHDFAECYFESPEGLLLHESSGVIWQALCGHGNMACPHHVKLCSTAQELLREVEPGPWEILARRRVQHFGYKFEYVVRSKTATLYSSSLTYAPMLT